MCTQSNNSLNHSNVTEIMSRELRRILIQTLFGAISQTTCDSDSVACLTSALPIRNHSFCYLCAIEQIFEPVKLT